jgi:hypothetical protein
VEKVSKYLSKGFEGASSVGEIESLLDGVANIGETV